MPSSDARALLDRLEAFLQVAHIGVERVVARLELHIRPVLPALTERPSSRTLQPAALAQPHRILQRDDQQREDDGQRSQGNGYLS